MSKDNNNLKQYHYQALDQLFELGFALTLLLVNKAPYQENWQDEPQLSKNTLIREINAGRCRQMGIRINHICGDTVAVVLDGPRGCWL